MRPTKFLAATLATVALLTTAVPALAYEPHDVRGTKRAPYVSQFGDLNDALWAQLSIEKAYQLGLMLGEGQGRFQPLGTLTREQAVVATIRLIGLESQAAERATADLRFTDAAGISPWARGAVALAVERGILPPAGDGALRARDPASRLWVSVLLVKALGYEAEAQSKVNATLNFSDAREIPANLVGYVATAADHQLIAGYTDSSFKPNRALTRAEMAALLSRGNGQLGDRAGQMQGTVTAVNAANGTLTVQGAHGTVTATLAAGAAVFVNGTATGLSAVQTGMTVWIKLSAHMQVTLVDATAASAPQTQTVTGTLTAVVQPQAGFHGVVTIQPPADGTPVTAAVPPQAVILYGSTSATFSALQVGQSVQAELTGGLITRITITATPNPAPTVQGRVIAFVPPSGSTTVLLFLLVGNGVSAHTISSSVPVRQGNNTLSFSYITANASVQLTLVSGAVTQINLI